MIGNLSPRTVLRPFEQPLDRIEARDRGPSEAADISSEAGRRPRPDVDKPTPENPGYRGDERERDAERRATETPGPKEPGDEDLDSEELREVRELRERDEEVRTHERAHTAAGGAYAGAPTYRYETGPDGRRYAVSGEVSIDTSEKPGDPRGSIAKLEKVVRAALAPASPSGQDQRVAASARAKIARLRAEVAEQQAMGLQRPEETQDGGAARRAAEAYARPIENTLDVGGTVSLKSCSDCGGSHPV
jgi:hypothetical protein